MFRIVLFSIVLFSAFAVFGQTETLDNNAVVEMSRSGLSPEIILKKIGSSRATFDVSATGLVELKKAGVDDSVIKAMMERIETSLPGEVRQAAPTAGQVTPVSPEKTFTPRAANGTVSSITRQEALTGAKTISFGKSSLHPSRQALEKELMKRKDFQQLNLTILRYGDAADLFVDIGYVSGSWVTHRYVYRIYDRRSGAVITAGETTSWGSLAENLARHIAKSLTAAKSGKMG